MKSRLFNRYALSVVIILAVCVVGIKVYSVLSFPGIHNWNYYQLQHIDRSKKTFSFAVFGDNKNSITTFSRLIDRLNRENDIIFAIDVGDLVYDGEKEKFRFFIKQISRLRMPLLTAIGNHELREGGRANYYDFFGAFYYSFTVGDSYFIVLDDANERNLDPWQMDWLKAELEKSRNFRYRFIFMHVPLYDPREGEYRVGHSLKDISFAQKLNALFDRYNITMLFVSHIHGYYRGVWGRTPYIITGGAGAELAGSDPEHYFYHYVKVSVAEGDVEYRVVKLPTPDFELMDRYIHDAWIYIYAFFAVHYLDLIMMLALAYLAFYIIFVKEKWLILGMGREKKE